MRIRQLEAFRATVITGTVSAAAKSLKTSQPTVSRHLIDLERELNVQLFRREKGRVQLTSEGLEFYHRADEVFTAFTALSTVTEDLQKDTFRDIRIISPPAISMTIVPEVMKRLLNVFPDIRAQLLMVDNHNYFEVKCEKISDIVLGNRIGFESNLEQIPLVKVDFVCALPEGHPLSEKSEISVADLEGETMISLLEDKHRLFLQHERVFADAGVSVTQNIYCHTSAAAYAMVQRGLGVALLEPFGAPIWENHGVVIRPFKPRLSYEFMAGLMPGALQSAAISQVISIARDVFEPYGEVL